MDASSIRWPASHYDPAKKFQHEFSVGDNVMIARLSPHILSDQSIIGHRGTIIEVDDQSMSSVEMQCRTCGGVHTMHEGELDYMGSSDLAEIRGKAGPSAQLELEVITEAETKTRNLEDSIAIAMHQAGFMQPAVEDRLIPVCDPDLPQPLWSKHAYGTIWRMAPFKAFHVALIEIARSVDGHLVEWASKSLQHGWVSITAADMETLTLEMSIRAVIQSRKNATDTAYDEAKETVSQWIEDKYSIDIASICKAVKPLNWKLSNWIKPSMDSEWCSVCVELPDDISSAQARDIFRYWAMTNWVWGGKFAVIIRTSRDHAGQGVEIEWSDGKVSIENESDVPF